MTLKKYVENNPFFFFLGTAATVAGVVAGVLLYFCHERIDLANQKSNLEISRLQRELVSIRRGLGENKYLDIRAFVHPRQGQPISPINPKAKYIADDGFYAILDLPDWDFKVMRDERAVIPIGCYNATFGVTLSLPSVIGREGVRRVLEPEMSAPEPQGLQRSAENVMRDDRGQSIRLTSG
jgi:hypothetical protein